MEQITITLSNTQARILKEQAARYNVQPLEFIQRRIDILLTQPKLTDETMDHPTPDEEERAAQFNAILADLLVRRHDLYVELAKGPQG